MKRKSIDELFDNLHITSINKKSKTCDKTEKKEKVYSQIEVDNLLKSQEEFLFHKFKKYIETIRNISDINIPHWTC